MTPPCTFLTGTSSISALDCPHFSLGFSSHTHNLYRGGPSSTHANQLRKYETFSVYDICDKAVEIRTQMHTHV